MSRTTGLPTAGAGYRTRVLFELVDRSYPT